MLRLETHTPSTRDVLINTKYKTINVYIIDAIYINKMCEISDI